MKNFYINTKFPLGKIRSSIKIRKFALGFVTEGRDFFEISRKHNRVRVIIEYDDCARPLYFGLHAANNYHNNVAFLDSSTLQHTIINILDTKIKPRTSFRVLSKIYNGLLYRKAKELLFRNVSNEILLFHKRIYSVVGPKHYKRSGIDRYNIGMWFNILKTKYISDYYKYNAAAAMAVNSYRQDPQFNIVSPELNWRETLLRINRRYSKPSKAFNKTIDAMPRAMSPEIYYHLPLNMPFPIYDKTIIILLAQAAKRGLESLIFRSSKDDIYHAIRQFSGLPKLKVINTIQASETMRHLADMPTANRYRGTISGLLRKSNKWHEQFHRERVNITYINATTYSNNTPTAHHPLGTPHIEGVTFLSSVDNVINESKEMQHCIASYSDRAVEGKTFLFHVSKFAETASVEVDINGCILQAYGPRNTKNRASEWGRKQLLQFFSNQSKIQGIRQQQ